MNTPTPLPAAERDALALLAASGLGAKLKAEAEAVRATRRREILAELRSSVEAHRAAATKHAAEAHTLKSKAAAAHAAWLTAQQTLAAAELAASNASDAAERAEGRALRELRDLGAAEIDATIRELVHVEHDARNAVDYRVVKSAPSLLGKTKDTAVERHPGMLDFVGRLRVLRVELEGLKLAPLTPAEIAARCKAALDEARGVALPPLPDNEPGRRELLAPPAGLSLS